MTDQALDVYTYDSYPNFAYCLNMDPLHSTDLNDRNWSGKLTEVRSICPHFGIMEQQSGANGWNTRMEAPAPKPGQILLWAMQSIAHGADYVSFFRWRTCTKGTEMYWHGILDYDNRDNRKLAEIHQVWDRVKAIEETTGAVYQARVGMLRDYDNIWDAQVDLWHQRLAWASEEEIFHAAQTSHTPLDYVYLLDSTDAAELAKYQVLFYPHPEILTQKREDLLKEYVAQGGTLIIGARSGQKDLTGQCVMTPMPGLLAAYDLDFYQGRAALTERSYGKGKTLHFGGTFTRQNVLDFLKYTGTCAPYESLIRLPECCELAVKEKDGKQYLFVLNFSAQPQTITLGESVTDMDTKEIVSGDHTLPAYGTKVFCRN